MSAARVAAALLVLAAAATAADQVTRVDLAATGLEASVAAASISELLGHPMQLADDLLADGRGGRALDLVLVAADTESTAQALAHALGCWWAPVIGGGARFSRARTLPPLGPLRVATYTSRLRGAPQLEEQVRTLMAPWLDGERGLVLHPRLGRWSATLDPSGQAELERVLTRIERPRPAVPALIPHPAQPPVHARLSRAIEAPDATALVPALAAAMGRSVALAADAQAAGPYSLHPAPLHELPLQLTAQGLPADWIGGVLCLGGAADERLHPGLRRRLAIIPVRHLAADAIAITALATRLQQDAAPGWWSQPGSGILPLEDAGMLLVAADDEALAAIMHQLERIDRAGGMGR